MAIGVVLVLLRSIASLNSNRPCRNEVPTRLLRGKTSSCYGLKGSSSMDSRVQFNDDFVAIEFASQCGLQDIVTTSRIVLLEGSTEFSISGRLTLSSDGLSP